MAPKLSIHALNTVFARLTQAIGVLAAIEATYTEQPVATMRHVLTAQATMEALDAVRELLDQAHGLLHDA